RITFTINGRPLWLCECAAVRPSTLSFTYVYPELSAFGGGGTGQSDDAEHLSADGLPERALVIEATYETHVTRLEVVLTVTNWARGHIRGQIACGLDADFADLLEAQSGQREQTADVRRQETASQLSFEYAHPRLPFRTDIIVI